VKLILWLLGLAKWWIHSYFVFVFCYFRYQTIGFYWGFPLWVHFFYPPYVEECSKFHNEVLRVTWFIRAFCYSKWEKALGWQVAKENGVDVTRIRFFNKWGGWHVFVSIFVVPLFFCLTFPQLLTCCPWIIVTSCAL
jgi:hypothetical protein